VVILSGVVKVASEDPEARYSTFNELVEFSKGLGVCVTYILDGIVVGEDEERGIRVAATSLELVRRAQRQGAMVLKDVALPPVPSMFLGLSRLHDLPAMLMVGSLGGPRSDDASVGVLLSFLGKVSKIKV